MPYEIQVGNLKKLGKQQLRKCDDTCKNLKMNMTKVRPYEY